MITRSPHCAPAAARLTVWPYRGVPRRPALTEPQSVAALTEGQTIPRLLHRNAVEYGDLPAVTSLDIEGHPTLTWLEFRTAIAEVSRGLAGLGLGRGDRMLIMAPGCPDHLIADLAAVHVGAIPCTAYATLSPDQIRFVARHSAAPVVVLGGAAELARWQPVLADLPALRHIVVMDAEAIPAVHPRRFFGGPRVWEKMVAGLKNMLGGVPAERRDALLAANELLQKGYKLRSAGEEVPAELAEQIAKTDEAALAPVRALLGLDKVLVASSGAAALPLEVQYFLAGLGVEILEVWGLSETTGAATSNSATAFRAGTVGKPVADVEIKVAEDGELLVRGPIVFLGYLQEDGTIKPATDADGWLPTGDIGTIDDDGFVSITDRKKELIITSSGKNIAPTRIEGLLKEHPLIGQAVAIGDDRP